MNKNTVDCPASLENQSHQTRMILLCMNCMLGHL
jgi:hypothetical protein